MARLDTMSPGVADAVYRSAVQMHSRLAGLRIQERCGEFPLTKDEQDLAGFLSALRDGHLGDALPEIAHRIGDLRAAARLSDRAVEARDCRLCCAAGRCPLCGGSRTVH